MVAYLPDGTRLLAGYVPSNVLSVIGLIVYGLLAFFGFLRSSSPPPPSLLSPPALCSCLRFLEHD
jgi:hypothetical protein